MNICSPCTHLQQMQNLQSMDYKYSFRDDATCILRPQKLQCSRKYKNANSQKYLGTFQLFMHSCNQNNKSLVTTTYNLFLKQADSYREWCMAEVMWRVMCKKHGAAEFGLALKGLGLYSYIVGRPNISLATKMGLKTHIVAQFLAIKTVLSLS